MGDEESTTTTVEGPDTTTTVETPSTPDSGEGDSEPSSQSFPYTDADGNVHDGNMGR